MKKAILVITISVLCGCSWQGQRHETFYPNGRARLRAEWWSMRCLWVSSGVEAFAQSPYYQAGATVARSQSDKEAIQSIAESAARGALGAIQP